MQLNVLDDLAEAMKALDGKKARMCYVSCMKVARWPQHDVLDGLFAHSAGNDAEWFENVWNWLRKHGMRLWCMLFYFVNLVDENDVFGKNSFASDVDCK